MNICNHLVAETFSSRLAAGRSIEEGKEKQPASLMKSPHISSDIVGSRVSLLNQDCPSLSHRRQKAEKKKFLKEVRESH